MTIMNRLFTIVIFSVLYLGACVPGHNDFSDFRNLPPSGWQYANVLTFNPEHGDSIAVGSVCVSLRHTDAYMFSNVWLEIEFVDADKTVHRDTVNFKLADIYGRWLGIGNATDFQVTDTVCKSLRHRSGSPVRVRHIMRVDTLTGIDIVGVTFNGYN